MPKITVFILGQEGEDSAVQELALKESKRAQAVGVKSIVLGGNLVCDEMKEPTSRQLQEALLPSREKQQFLAASLDENLNDACELSQLVKKMNISNDKELEEAKEITPALAQKARKIIEKELANADGGFVFICLSGRENTHRFAYMLFSILQKQPIKDASSKTVEIRIAPLFLSWDGKPLPVKPVEGSKKGKPLAELYFYKQFPIVEMIYSVCIKPKTIVCEDLISAVNDFYYERLAPLLFPWGSSPSAKKPSHSSTSLHIWQKPKEAPVTKKPVTFSPITPLCSLTK